MSHPWRIIVGDDDAGSTSKTLSIVEPPSRISCSLSRGRCDHRYSLGSEPIIKSVCIFLSFYYDHMVRRFGLDFWKLVKDSVNAVQVINPPAIAIGTTLSEILFPTSKAIAKNLIDETTRRILIVIASFENPSLAVFSTVDLNSHDPSKVLDGSDPISKS